MNASGDCFVDEFDTGDAPQPHGVNDKESDVDSSQSDRESEKLTASDNIKGKGKRSVPIFLQVLLVNIFFGLFFSISFGWLVGMFVYDWLRDETMTFVFTALVMFAIGNLITWAMESDGKDNKPDKKTRNASKIILIVIAILGLMITPSINQAANNASIIRQEETKARDEKRGGAICNDGTRSYSTGRGTCSHHGGVAEWL